MDATSLHVSIARADSQVGLVFKAIAGILLLVGLLLAFFDSGSGVMDRIVGAGAVLGAAAGLWFLPGALVARTEVTTDEIVVQCMKVFRVTLRIADVQGVVDDSNLPTGGYGLRWVGKGHHAFVSGGSQVTVTMKSGKLYTISVESVEGFLGAYGTAAAAAGAAAR
ncbi:hypothetical protein [Paeniglutamicibacter kerguelensis]|uniref:Bacterial Pleckstrin homology domain-containing protein n=1 Tax=Paeniglutamicibacter kerguelensis TaxID=254788 RepID=A0ABS4XDZ2_9MICC|nr:hypothetical protein [Paeniglutamicibacter kerguelensis]MBP2386698.1 hypothetical protein [Paeniglutamicibacter kerguelensis]